MTAAEKMCVPQPPTSRTDGTLDVLRRFVMSTPHQVGIRAVLELCVFNRYDSTPHIHLTEATFPELALYIIFR
jgi:hypothetical protein